MYPVVYRALKQRLVQDEIKMPEDQACEVAVVRFQVSEQARVPGHTAPSLAPPSLRQPARAVLCPW